MTENNQITDEMVADPNAEPPIWETEEVEWTDEVDDADEPESTGEDAPDEEDQE